MMRIVGVGIESTHCQVLTMSMPVRDCWLKKLFVDLVGRTLVYQSSRRPRISFTCVHVSVLTGFELSSNESDGI